MDRRVAGLVLFGAFVIGGCSHRPEIVYVEWMRSPRQSDVVGGRFELYARAASMAESSSPKYLKTVVFTPGKRDACLTQITPAIKTLEEGSRRAELGYRFKPQMPFEQPEFVAGWRLLGRGLVWRIERAVKSGDYGSAIADTILASRFGLDLLGGGAIEASLGMAIADDARRALAPALDRLDTKQLTTLHLGMKGCLNGMPDLLDTLDNERMNMLAGVQSLQDSYRGEAWTKLVDSMGPDVRTAVDRLKKMREEDPIAAVTYFKGLADEAEEEAKFAERLAQVPAIERYSVPEPIKNGSRPWRRFARHFVGTLRPLLKQYDATIARTRLFVIESQLQQAARTNTRYPASLLTMDKGIVTDPYSGQPFVYRADGGACKVYSIGEDLSDDGGQTDESFSAPDLRLEVR